MNSVDDFLLIAEIAPVSLIFLDSEQKLVWGNRVWAEYTGANRSDVLPLSFAVHPDDRASLEHAVREIYASPRHLSNELRYLRKDGIYRDFQLQGSPYIQDDKIIGLVCVLYDITDQHMIEEQMLTLNDSLEALVEERTRDLKIANAELKNTQAKMLHHEKMASVGQLAAGVAHEINNPVGFIASNLNSLDKYMERLNDYIVCQEQLLSKHLTEDDFKQLMEEKTNQRIDFFLDDGHDLIIESLEGTERVKQIVKNLKSFSRVDQTKELHPIDLNECLENTVAIAWNELKYKATLEKDFGELPLLLCHPQQMNQVFMNLLLNSAQAIAERGVIRIKTWEKNETIYIQISDSGCGIEPENLSRIFEPFFTTKDVGKGTGLGMSISYDIIRAHGGDINVSSTVGEGTTFTLELPITEESRLCE